MLDRGLGRIDRIASRRRAQLQLLVGGLVVAGLWAWRTADPVRAVDLARHPLVWAAIAAFGAAAVHGALAFVWPDAEPSATGTQRFGGYVEARRDERAWIRRLLAVALGIVHASVFSWS